MSNQESDQLPTEELFFTPKQIFWVLRCNVSEMNIFKQSFGIRWIRLYVVYTQINICPKLSISPRNMLFVTISCTKLRLKFASKAEKILQILHTTHFSPTFSKSTLCHILFAIITHQKTYFQLKILEIFTLRCAAMRFHQIFLSSSSS